MEVCQGSLVHFRSGKGPSLDLSLYLLRPSHDGPKPQNPEQWPGRRAPKMLWQVSDGDSRIIQRSGIVGCTDTKAKKPMN
jgi:hypothetical protein